MMDLDDKIMWFRERVVPQRRWRAPVAWVRQWLRRCEDWGQYHNLIAEPYEDVESLSPIFMDVTQDIHLNFLSID